MSVCSVTVYNFCDALMVTTIHGAKKSYQQVIIWHMAYGAICGGPLNVRSNKLQAGVGLDPAGPLETSGALSRVAITIVLSGGLAGPRRR